MPSRPRKPPAHDKSFIDRHDLWSDEQRRAAVAVEKAIARHKLDVVRFSFVDQHGALRGKTLMASEAAAAMRSGVTMTTTLLAKDTSHRTVFPVFSAGGGLRLAEMQGAGDFIMTPDPTTFRVLPWTPNTGWMLCDIVFPNGRPVPFSTRQLYRDALARLAAKGLDYVAGLEVEFHLFKIADPRLATEDVASWPGVPPGVSLTTQGFQYLTEARYDQVDPILDVLRQTLAALGLPLRSMEVELGPSQYEFTFAPASGLAPADMMVLFRSAMKQVARRHGYLVSLMCRPRFPNMFSCGWHLHQSLVNKKTKANAFVSSDKAEILSLFGRNYLAGLLANARAAAAFATPTINGYKRYRTYSMAPVQAIWACDNRGVMVRVMGRPGDPATHLENRLGEPLANPYLYMASQIHAGLDGVARTLAPGPSADRPYDGVDAPLPKTLGEALDALAASACFRSGFGDGFVDYYVDLKRAEIARFDAETKARGEHELEDAMAITDWEQREYFDLV